VLQLQAEHLHLPTNGKVPAVWVVHTPMLLEDLALQLQHIQLQLLHQQRITMFWYRQVEVAAELQLRILLLLL